MPLLIAVIGLYDRCDLTVRGKLYQALWRCIHDTLKRETAVELSNRRCGQYIRQSADRRLEALHQLFPRRGKLLLREKTEAEKPLEDGKGKAEIGFSLKLMPPGKATLIGTEELLTMVRPLSQRSAALLALRTLWGWLGSQVLHIQCCFGDEVIP